MVRRHVAGAGGSQLLGEYGDVSCDAGSPQQLVPAAVLSRDRSRKRSRLPK